MWIFMLLGGTLLFLLTVFALAVAKSDIQLILAALCFGFGLLAFGLAGIMSRLDDWARERQRGFEIVRTAA